MGEAEVALYGSQEHWQELSTPEELFGVPELAGYPGALSAAQGTQGYLSPMNESQDTYLGPQLLWDFPLV